MQLRTGIGVDPQAGAANQAEVPASQVAAAATSGEPGCRTGAAGPTRHVGTATTARAMLLDGAVARTTTNPPTRPLTSSWWQHSWIRPQQLLTRFVEASTTLWCGVCVYVQRRRSPGELEGTWTGHTTAAPAACHGTAGRPCRTRWPAPSHALFFPSQAGPQAPSCCMSAGVSGTRDTAWKRGVMYFSRMAASCELPAMAWCSCASARVQASRSRGAYVE